MKRIIGKPGKAMSDKGGKRAKKGLGAEQDLPSPAVHTALRPHLRVLGTEITLLEQLRVRAERDLGIDITFEMLDFLSAQCKAATEPDAFDIYDQCFHNVDIVWFWRAIQPIDTQRISLWGEVNELTKSGRISAYAPMGRGDAPVNKLYVQPGLSLGPLQSGRISMLPTVHNFDSFAYLPDLFPGADPGDASWSWLLDERAKGRLALVDEPAIGVFDAALACEARGDIRFADIGNMTAPEIDKLMTLLSARRREGYFCGLWKTAAESAELMADGRAAIQSMWSPGTSALMRAGVPIREAVPREGYRAWHGGMCLSARLSGRLLDVAYEYLNWWLSGWPGAVMARQGYYMSVPERVRDALPPEEWDYWYEGAPASRDLPGTDGEITVRAGSLRPGGSYRERASHIAVWNTTMDEHNYLVRRWSQFAAACAR
ncbi:putative spermidine/putrescine transport system substrate-binding protein [Rhizobiales bacterium GAS191]|nr:putative spermidine/putrescine transport system substrate-binding protein [Rhizobiales bacterium GAS113]SEB86545.1 putative spermidine/putrescine transport system substrate-binding protein [Rhizobiales bacterium GAS191]